MNESVVGLNQVALWEGFVWMSLFSLSRSQRHLSSDHVTTTSKDSQFPYWVMKDMRLSHSHPWWPRHVKVCARNPEKTSITTLWEEHNLQFLDLPSPLAGFSSFLFCHVQVWCRISGSCITVLQTWSLCEFLNSTLDPNWLDSLSKFWCFSKRNTAP